VGSIHVIRAGAFRRDAELLAAVADIAAASFHDQAGRLESVLARCDTLYLARDERGEVMCFFLVAWESLSIDGVDVPALYGGLCAARPSQKGMGTAVKLFNCCMADAQRWERRRGERLVVWGLTATPSVLLPIRKVFANVQPAGDASYSDRAGRVALAVRPRLGVPPQSGAPPFALPGVAAGVRYTERERRRVEAVCRAKRFSLFDRLGIDEARGDRLLFVAEVPDTLWRPVGTVIGEPPGC
jgi:hypothetical protein